MVASLIKVLVGSFPGYGLGLTILSTQKMSSLQEHATLLRSKVNYLYGFSLAI